MYNTKQSEAVLNFISSQKDKHLTAAQIIKHFENGAAPIGRATVYRHLDKLTEAGKLRKYVTDEKSGACYQFSDKENCHIHLHLKCESCNELQHIECDTLNEIQTHISAKHAFQVNAQKTVLYGKCKECIK
jgi:Fur family ferric uptake transcriptional regulator